VILVITYGRARRPGLLARFLLNRHCYYNIRKEGYKDAV
jgi:hypothetical protein